MGEEENCLGDMLIVRFSIVTNVRLMVFSVKMVHECVILSGDTKSITVRVVYIIKIV